MSTDTRTAAPPFGWDEDGRPITAVFKAQRIVHEVARELSTATNLEGRSMRYRQDRIVVEAAAQWQKLMDVVLQPGALGGSRQAMDLIWSAQAHVSMIFRAAVGTISAPALIKERGIAPYDLFNHAGHALNLLHHMAQRYNEAEQLEAAKYQHRTAAPAPKSRSAKKPAKRA